MCDATERVQLHHVAYERIGREADSDLVPLCHQHHAAIHRVARDFERREAERRLATNTGRIQPTKRRRNRAKRPMPNWGPVRINEPAGTDARRPVQYARVGAGRRAGRE